MIGRRKLSWLLGSSLVLCLMAGCNQDDPYASNYGNGYGNSMGQPSYAPTGQSAKGGVGYAVLNQQIFMPTCGRCHSFSYQGLISEGVVIPGNARSSRLCQEVASGDMPQGGPALSSQQINAICTWIQNGAPQ